MHRTSILFPLLFLFACAVQLSAQCVVESQPIAITDITVIPMTDTTTVLSNQTVLIAGDIITRIGSSADVLVPPGSFVVNGKGKYLLPGLCDMHAHLLNRSDAVLELVNGVTTVSNMHGEPWHVSFRDSIRGGSAKFAGNTLAAPQVFTSGPIMNYMGHPFFDPAPIQRQDQALASLRSQDSIGYDFYKTYTYLTKGVFGAVQTHAATTGKVIRGHGNDWLGISEIIKSRQRSIEHFWGYLPNDSLDQVQLDLEQSTLASGTWNCPTLVVRWNREHLDSIRSNEPGYVRYVCPRSLVNNWRNVSSNPEEYSNVREYMKLLVRLHRAGGKIMLGSDNLTPYSVAGFSVHEELDLFVRAGLSPHQALSLATSAPYEFLRECGLDSTAGTLRSGMKADVLLLSRNPLEDIRNTKFIDGVIGRGRYYSAQCLQELLSKVSCEGTVDVAEVHADERMLVVHPNPAQTTITISGLPEHLDGKLMIIDSRGHVVVTSGFATQLSIAQLAAGAFYLLAFDGHTYYSQQFIKY